MVLRGTSFILILFTLSSHVHASKACQSHVESKSLHQVLIVENQRFIYSMDPQVDPYLHRWRAQLLSRSDLPAGPFDKARFVVRWLYNNFYPTASASHDGRLSAWVPNQVDRWVRTKWFQFLNYDTPVLRSEARSSPVREILLGNLLRLRVGACVHRSALVYALLDGSLDHLEVVSGVVTILNGEEIESAGAHTWVKGRIEGVTYIFDAATLGIADAVINSDGELIHPSQLASILLGDYMVTAEKNGKEFSVVYKEFERQPWIELSGDQIHSGNGR